MSPASQDGHPFQIRAGAHSLRFRDLLHRLFSMANQGFKRPEFLQMASGSILEFLGCDLLEVRLEEAGRACRCRATVEGGASRFICDAPTQRPEAPVPGPQGAPPMDSILDSMLRGQFLAAAPFFTRGGSFWTGDATRPILLREDRQYAQAQARSLVLGGDYLSLAVVPVPVDDRIRAILQLGFRKAESFTRDDLPFFEAVGETLGVAVAFQASQWALRERVKELDCLYSIAQVSQRPDLALDEQLKEIVSLLPPAWQYPELTSGRITLDGRAYATPTFRETPWTQEAPLRVGDRERGRVQVAYNREMPVFDEGPFLQEERSLIQEVARQVAITVGRWEDEKSRAQLFHMLEQRRE
ncbi:MAG: GAF domain-containing protein [Holophaga sp.]|nr:GAF domain-containing protein [Holophaga sp.]